MGTHPEGEYPRNMYGEERGLRSNADIYHFCRYESKVINRPPSSILCINILQGGFFMLILIKLVSFAIWLVIMAFIISAGLGKKRTKMPKVSSVFRQDNSKTLEVRNYRMKV